MRTSKKLNRALTVLSYAGLSAFCLCVIFAAYNDKDNFWLVNLSAGIIFSLVLLGSFFCSAKLLKLNGAIASLIIGIVLSAFFIGIF